MPNRYHAYIYNVGFEIENLNDMANTVGENLYQHYWEKNPKNDDDQVKDAIKAIVLSDVSLNHDYLPEDVDFGLLDLDSQINILNHAIEDYFDDGSVQVHRISLDSNLYPWLLDWYGFNDEQTKASLKVEKNINEHVSNCYLTDQYLYFTSGRGYDTLDADLLGGDGSGEHAKAFQDFLNGEVNPKIETIRNHWLQ